MKQILPNFYGADVFCASRSSIKQIIYYFVIYFNAFVIIVKQMSIFIYIFIIKGNYDYADRKKEIN